MIGRALVRIVAASLLTGFLDSLAFAGPLNTSGSLTLAWDASSDSNVVGYRLYQGGASQVYTNMVDIGNATLALIPCLVEGGTYYFAVTAYDSAGLESAFSGEISYTAPTTAPRVPSTVPRLFVGQDASSQFVLLGTGPVGSVYDIWATSDLASWSVIGSVSIGAAGSFQFTDPASLTVPNRFYQLRQSTALPGIRTPPSGSASSSQRPISL